MILIIDNYDSFVHNLTRYIRQICNEQVSMVRNDAIDIDELDPNVVSAVVLSPGPCGPQDAGFCIELVNRLHDQIPILGVCLGHQIIVEAFGGVISKTNQPMHGKSCQVFHEGNEELFANIPSPFTAARYHSLIADPMLLPTDLKKIATADDQTLMAVRHKTHPVFGIQSHPESVLTEYGYQFLANFLGIAGIVANMPAKGFSI